MLLADDHENVLLGAVTDAKQALKQVYDFDLMEDGGHITGYLVDGAYAEAFSQRLSDYTATVSYTHLYWRFWYRS